MLDINKLQNLYATCHAFYIRIRLVWHITHGISHLTFHNLVNIELGEMQQRTSLEKLTNRKLTVKLICGKLVTQ